MPEKLDPELRNLVETMAPGAAADARATVVVMVALRRAPDAAETARLEGAGLTLRSAVGDIATGTIAVGDLARLAADPLVVKIESSRPLEPERP